MKIYEEPKLSNQFMFFRGGIKAIDDILRYVTVLSLIWNANINTIKGPAIIVYIMAEAVSLNNQTPNKQKQRIKAKMTQGILGDELFLHTDFFNNLHFLRLSISIYFYTPT